MLRILRQQFARLSCFRQLRGQPELVRIVPIFIRFSLESGVHFRYRLVVSIEQWFRGSS